MTSENQVSIPSEKELVPTKKQATKRLFNPDIVEDGLATQWKPGDSGNPAGRPKNSVTTLLKNRNPEDNQKIADKLYQLALEGDMSAIREYIDRTDGKVVDKHINVNVTTTPELLMEAQARLREAQVATDNLLEEHPKRATE